MYSGGPNSQPQNPTPCTLNPTPYSLYTAFTRRADKSKLSSFCSCLPKAVATSTISHCPIPRKQQQSHGADASLNVPLLCASKQQETVIRKSKSKISAGLQLRRSSQQRHPKLGQSSMQVDRDLLQKFHKISCNFTHRVTRKPLLP